MEGIKYSDLLIPDEAVSNAIKQFTQLREVAVKNLEDIKKEAKEIESLLKLVNNTTPNGRGQTGGAADDTARLAKAYEDAKKAASSYGEEIAALKAEMRELNNINKLNAQLNKSAEGSFDKLSALYGLNKIKLNAMSAEMRKNTTEGMALEKQTHAIYQEMIKLQEATGKHTLSVGHYEKANIRLGTSINQLSRELPALGVNMNTFFLAISNNIPMLVDEINNVRAANAQLVKEGKQVSSLGKQLTGAIFSWQTAMSVGIALLTIYGAKFVELSVSIFKAKDSLDLLVKKQEQLNEIQKDYARLASDDLSRFRILTSAINDNNRSMTERLTAVRQLKKEWPEYYENLSDEYILAGKSTTQNNLLAESILKVARSEAYSNRVKKNQERILQIEDEIEAEYKLYDAKNEALLQGEKALKLFPADANNQAIRNAGIQREVSSHYNNILALNNERAVLSELNDEYVKEIGITEKRAKIEEKTKKGQKDPVDKTLQYLRQAEDYRISLIKDDEERELERSRVKNQRLIEDLQNEKNVTEKGKEAIAESIRNIEELSAIEISDIQQKYRDKEFQAEQKWIDILEKNADKIYDARMTQFDEEYDLKMSEIDLEEKTEAEKTKLRLQAEKERLQKIIDYNESTQNRLSAIQIAIYKNMIQAIDQEIKSSGTKDIYQLLGIEIDEDKKKGIASSTAFAISQLNAIMEAEVRIAEIAVRNAEKKIAAAQKALDYELEAKANGYAYNVTYAQKELELAKKNQEKALKEQEKAQKAQNAIATIEQTVNLVTATALIWKQLGIFAPPAILTMWGLFAAAKIKAAQLTKAQTKEYGEGGLEILEGGSHASGRDIPIGTTKDGKSRRAEGGEALIVINKAKTRKYRNALPDIVNSLNKGVFDTKYLKAFDQGTSVSMINNSADLSKLEGDVREIRKQGDKKMISDGKRLIIKYKNLTTYVNN